MKFTAKSERWIPTYIGLCFTLVLSFLLFFQAEPLNYWIDYVGNHAGDLQLRIWSKPLEKESPVVVVYIDDASLNQEGWNWPWSRKIFAKLTDKLQQLGASVIAFDMIFPDVEENIATQVVERITNNPQVPERFAQQIKGEEGRFDYNQLFAQSMENGTTVMGIIFTKKGGGQGELPPPSLTLSPEISQELQILEMKNFVANIPLLQRAAKHAGFINGFPDLDGVYRFSPLLVRMGNDVYFSLALEAVSLFTSSRNVFLKMDKYQGKDVLEGIRLNEKEISLTPQGEILIPYRAKGSNFTSYSALDVLNDRLAPNTLDHKLVFVGFSASSLGDLVATPIKPLAPGVDIHATIAAGIIDGYLPYKPAWGKGVAVILVFFLGLFCSLLFPRLGSIATTIIASFLLVSLFLANRFVWLQLGIILPFSFPFLVVLTIYTTDMLSGYFFETKRYQIVRKVFSQYVPAEYVEQLLEKEPEFGLRGESKELTVLFSDIQDFNSITEKFSAPEIKEYLERFLTPMTELIFINRGTLDKYIGGVIMAFWGAPLEDPKAASHAVIVALSMQKKLGELNGALKTLNRPEISIGVGINTGAMYVGDMGSQFRRAYTVIGDAVNLASRLEGLTKMYRVPIIAGEQTQKQTNNEFLYRKLDRVRVKGKKNLVEIYQPLCAIGDASDTMRKELQLHEEALESYLRGNLEQSKAQFQKLIDSYPENRFFYEGYLARIAASVPAPPL